MSFEAEALDIDDSDILRGFFRRTQPSLPVSHPSPPRSQHVASLAAPRSASQLHPSPPFQLGTVSGILSRFRKPQKSGCLDEVFDGDGTGTEQRSGNIGFRSNAALGNGCVNDASCSPSALLLSGIGCDFSRKRKHSNGQDTAQANLLFGGSQSRRMTSNAGADRQTQRVHASSDSRPDENALLHEERRKSNLHCDKETGDIPSHHTESPPPRQDLPYRIPGPAGAVQTGLIQNRHHCSETYGAGPKNMAPSRANDSRAVADDAEFTDGPWLAALSYLNKQKGHCSIVRSMISSIKTCRTENRVRKLVAVIKTCTPNGCGDVFVTLKDDSGTIGGTIHRNVMTETEFGRDIEPGAVILLHEVAVFSPTPYAHYLNITMNNVEQVFKKGVQTSKRQTCGPEIFNSQPCLKDMGGGHKAAQHEKSILSTLLEEEDGEFVEEIMQKKDTDGKNSLTNLLSSAANEIVSPQLACGSTPGSAQNSLESCAAGRSNLILGSIRPKFFWNNDQGQPCVDYPVSLPLETHDTMIEGDGKYCFIAPACMADVYEQLLDDTDISQSLLRRPLNI